MTTAAAVSIVHAHFAASIAATERFFAAEAPRVADCCRQMAERFAAGGTLYVAGMGAQASDAHHVSVEFVHPIIVGKRALRAVALTSDAGLLTSWGGLSSGEGFARPLETTSLQHDILLALASGALPPALQAGLLSAKGRDLLTVLVTGESPPDPVADITFTIGERNSLIVQEVAETLYHVIWELVHVFLDAHEPNPAAFLATAPVSDAELRSHVIESTLQKSADIVALRRAVLAACESGIAAAGAAIAARIRRGGRLFAFGNGGSATDAQDVTADAIAPPIAGWRSFPAMALTTDIGVLTAIANDVGFEHVFARQLAAFAGPHDVALGFSTSGASRNIRAAMAEAKSRGLLTIAMSGGQGGHLLASPDVDFCFTAPSEHLPRIQEAHATAWHALLATTHEALP